MKPLSRATIALLIGGLLVTIFAGVTLGRQYSADGQQTVAGPNEQQAAQTEKAASQPAAQAGKAASQPAAPTTQAAVAKQPNYLSTAGSKIVDAAGNEVRLTGVNWFGMETNTFSPHGLWLRNWQDMLDQIAAAGFNTIRLPFASTVLDPNARPMEGIDYKLNPDLRGLTALEIMDKIIAGAGERGLKVLLDQHRPNTEAQSKLWYTDFFPESQWIADWQTLAKRYAGNDAVIGADLHNEPAGDARWGGDDPKLDWRAAAERAGNAILDVNPNWLIVVEGVEKIEKDWYWMGGSLQLAGSNPVNLKVPNKLVYSAHDYGPGVFEQEWFKDPRFPANLPAIWDKHWGYLVKQGIAPVIVGEFGGKSVSERDREGQWQRALLHYMQEHGISFTYWSFNPNSVDTGGMLQDDWKTLNSAKTALLGSYLTPKLAVNTPHVVDRSAVASGVRKNPLPAQPIKAQLAVGKTEARTEELSLKLLIINQTAANVPLPSLELRYWLSPAEATLAGLARPVTRNGDRSVKDDILGIDWASTDGVKAELIGGQAANPPYLRVTFTRDEATLPSYGKVEVQLRVNRPDKLPFVQTDQFSFKPANQPVDNEAISLYFWGDRVWGQEPAQNGSAPSSATPQVGEQAPPTAVAGVEVVEQAKAQGQYVVKPGDTLRRIATQAYGDENAWPRIAGANSDLIENPDLIYPGDTLQVPAP